MFIAALSSQQTIEIMSIFRTYKNILDCYYIKTAKVCGLKAASTLKELMVEVIDCTIKEKCSISKNPSIHSPMPEKYISILNKARVEYSYY